MAAISSEKLNEYIEIAHKAAKPFIIKGMKAGIAVVDKKTAESATILDNLLWGDLKESFQISE